MINNITKWLDETAKQYPNKVAIVDGERTITFQELRYKALCLAEVIVKKGLFKEPVAVMMPKSMDVIVCFLGIAYSGNFYSVIDTEMPLARQKKVLETLEPKLIITMPAQEKAWDIDSYQYDYEKMELSCEEKVMEQREHTCDADLLYVLFTSGSTGIPKGVTIAHQSVVDYIDWVEETFDIRACDSFGNQAPFYFDNSVLDIYTAIKTGATIYLIPKELFSQPVLLLEYLKKNKITTIFWVPSAMIIVANLHALKKVDLSETLKKILFAGEVMPNKQLNIWRKHIPDAMYANLYGPTEITVDCTYYIVDRAFKDSEPLPIGKRAKNTDVLVLNEQNEPVNINEVGELCVRGVSLSKGYYNNIEKTREVFIQNPLNTKYIEYIYRTGDLVKYNEQGELLYVSRKDDQVKHLGHRIELGEIEVLTFGMDETKQCCCMYDSIKSRIILFVEGAVNSEDIFMHLKNNLPYYMIPARIVHISEFPMTPNGKIDRRELQKLI